MKSKLINLTITGCMGRMGQQLIKATKKTRGYSLYSLTEYKQINKKISGIFVLGSKRPVKIKYLMKNLNRFRKVKLNYRDNYNGFNLDISRAIKYKIPLDFTKKMFLKFLNENFKSIKN